MERHGFLAFMVRRNLARADAMVSLRRRLRQPRTFRTHRQCPPKSFGWEPLVFCVQVFCSNGGIVLGREPGMFCGGEAARQVAGFSRSSSSSMGPRLAAPEREIVGIGRLPARRLL